MTQEFTYLVMFNDEVEELPASAVFEDQTYPRFALNYILQLHYVLVTRKPAERLDLKPDLSGQLVVKALFVDDLDCDLFLLHVINANYELKLGILNEFELGPTRI